MRIEPAPGQASASSGGEGPTCIYVAYGSNTDPDRLGRYLDDLGPEAATHSTWLSLPRALYFAADSKTWGGPVAFLSIVEDDRFATQCRAFEMNERQLGTIFRRENGVGELPTLERLDLQPGGWRQILIPFGKDARRGKYNAIIRLADIDGRPSYTFSTSRQLHLGRPTAAYIAAMLAGLSQWSDEVVAREYLDRAIEAGAETNEAWLDDATRPLWTGSVRRGGAAGFPVVRMPASLSPVPGTRSFLGHISTPKGRVSTWVDFSQPDSAAVQVAGAVASMVGIGAGAVQPACIELEPVIKLSRRGGLLNSIPLSDVALVSRDAFGADEWLLAISPHYSGPLRAKPHDSVGSNEVRLAYAARTLLSLGSDDHVAYQAIPSARPGSLARGHLLRRLVEMLLGAPTVALRATEGLVGDDGRQVARADPTAFDFLGIAPGDRAIVSWGPRATKVRLLAQTTETRECMKEQLAETTGRQTRDSLADVDSRQQIPPHLGVWVSSTVRHQMAIPPDTVVRLRRDLFDVLLRSTTSAAVPGAALIIAAAALPSVPLWIWALAGLVVLTLVVIPLRRR